VGNHLGAESEVDSRGRITIPKRLREELQIRPGDRFRFEEHDEAILLRRETRAIHTVRSGRSWGREPFLDAGKATFGEG
jgi:AbrB family looped-hinge helix DNA binding protein